MVATGAPAPRSAVAPVVWAQVVLWTVVGANLLLVEALFATAGEGKNALLTVAKFFGLHLALLMMLQILLVARIPWLDRRIGMDRLTSWHRWVGFGLAWTALSHASFIVVGYADLDDAPLWRTFKALAGVPAGLFGVLAAAIIAVVVAFSVRAVRRRLPYEVWHAIHVCVYAAIVLGLIHQALETTTLVSSRFATVYWWTMWTLVLGAFLYGRVVTPLWRNAYHRFRVAAVVPESDNVVSVHVTGRHLDKLPARAGQFCIWRFPGFNPPWQANPFSLSAAPNGAALRLTAKAVGKTSARLRHLPVGTRVFLEGPYGAFTTLHQTRPATVLIAGGVGVTPVRSLLEESTGPVTVLYRVRSTADAVLLGELRALAAMRGAQVHLLAGRTGEGSPPNSPFDPHNLVALVPDIAERDVYVCGPPAMTEAVLRSLRALGVPRLQVHAEKFSLA